jgi:IPT/TIG domain
MITVAEVMKETSFCHPGNGRKTIIPTPKAKRMLNQGTPPPSITTLGTTIGSTTGGTSVAISGASFAEVKSVSFGSTSASSYTIDSEGQITAVSPAGSAGSVPISVTTVAGTATSSQQFTYQAPPTPPPPPTCTVPRLKGKTLKASKKKIKGADCKVGKVTKKKGAKAKTGKVVGQNKKPGPSCPRGRS